MSERDEKVYDILEEVQDQSSDASRTTLVFLFGALIVSTSDELTDLYWELKESPKYCDEALELTYYILEKSKCPPIIVSKLQQFVSETPPTLPPALVFRELAAEVAYIIRDANAKRLIDYIARYKLFCNPSKFYTTDEGNYKGLLQLFVKAEQQQCITAENVTVLEEYLEKMKRKDLVTLVNAYTTKKEAATESGHVPRTRPNLPIQEDEPPDETSLVVAPNHSTEKEEEHPLLREPLAIVTPKEPSKSGESRLALSRSPPPHASPRLSPNQENVQSCFVRANNQHLSAGTVFATHSHTQSVANTSASISSHGSQREKKAEIHGHSGSPAMLPFVDQIDVLKCDSSGRVFTNSDHDITLRVPEGAVPDGVTVHIEAGVALRGPFQFPPGTRPISPIVWFCMQEGIPFLKPVEVILPHYLHNWEDFDLGFLKADHTTNDGEKRYTFHPMNERMGFHFENGQGFGILFTKHFCSLCIASNIPHDELPSKAQYCLTQIIPDPWPFGETSVPLHFCVTFFSKTCFQTLKKQFPSSVKTSRSQFSFQTPELDHSEPRLQIDKDKPQSGWCVAQVSQKEIRASTVDYWKDPISTLELKEEENMYPPRFTVVACGTMATDNSVLTLSFKGSCEDLCTEVLLPLHSQANVFPVRSTPPLSTNSTSSISPSVEGGCAPSRVWNDSDYHPEDGRPTLPELLMFQAENRNISVPEETGTNYTKFGILLLSDENGAIVDGIVKKHRENTEDICTEILKKWLQGRGKTPATWRTLIDVLRFSKLSELANVIHRNLSRLT